MKKPFERFIERVSRELKVKYKREIPADQVWVLLQGHPDIGWSEDSPHEVAWQLDRRMRELEQPR